MTGKSSRAKGAQAEREVAEIIRGFGYDAKRSSMTQAAGFGADVTWLPGYHTEVKRQERIEIVKWCEQAEAAVARSENPLDIPLVVFRNNRQPWRVTILLSDFLHIVE